jgi:alpha-tubulin suppressor-like RCC1 family protein
VQVGVLTTWSNIAAGVDQMIATKTDGTLWSWGRNYNGQLGLNDTANRSSPVQVGALTTWSKVATGAQHCLAIKTNGTLWSWGYNHRGQLGIENINKYSSPVQIGALTKWSVLPNMPMSNSSFALKT